MLSESERKSKKIRIHNVPHFVQGLKERGKSLFKKDRTVEIYSEIEKHMVNPSRCAFVKDERQDSQSNYIAMFVTDAGGFVAIPCFIDDNFITLFTIKDVSKDDYPNWYLSKYREIGKERELYPISITFSSEPPKDLNSTMPNR